MKLKKFLLLILLIIFLIPNIGYGENIKPKAYLLVMNKITLEDFKSMDNIKDIIEDGSLGLMNTRSTSSYLGAGSYLTINASKKAYADDNSMKFEQDLESGKIKNNSIGKIKDINTSNKYNPHIGALGDNLSSKKIKTSIYGNSGLIDENRNPAALIPMNSEGIIDYGDIDNITIEDEKYPFNIRTDYDKLLQKVENSFADFIVIDTGDLERIYRYTNNLSKEEYNNIRNEILEDLDVFVGKLIQQINLNEDILIITSPNQGDSNIDNSRLSPIIITGDKMGRGSLISSTTKRENIVSNIDLAPTIIDFFEAPKNNLSGKVINLKNERSELDKIIKINDQINTTSKARYNNLFYYGLISMIAISLVSILKLVKIRIFNRGEEIINLIFMTLLSIPSIFLIISILRPSSLKSYYIILFTLITLIAFLIWITKKSKKQALYISGFTVFLILLDIILKGKISMYSVLSHDPIIGARYYGIGNEMVGLLLGSIVVFGKKIIEKTNNFVIPGIVFLLALILIGNPSMGANVGGTLTFLITIIIYFIGILEIKIDYKKIILVGISILIIISLISYVDIRLNENTSHLGNTILLIKENGLKQINNIVLRKILMNIKLIGTSFWTYLLLVHMFFYLVIFNLTNKVYETNLKTIIPGLVGSMAGFLLNDSGIILAAIAMNIITLEFYINRKCEIEEK